jgi:hypothetical protein
MVYNNNLQEMINNGSCDTTHIPNLGEYTQTNTFGKIFKIYYDFSKGKS